MSLETWVPRSLSLSLVHLPPRRAILKYDWTWGGCREKQRQRLLQARARAQMAEVARWMESLDRTFSPPPPRKISATACNTSTSREIYSHLPTMTHTHARVYIDNGARAGGYYIKTSNRETIQYRSRLSGELWIYPFAHRSRLCYYLIKLSFNDAPANSCRARPVTL